MLETTYTERPALSGRAFAFALRAALSQMSDSHAGLAERVAPAILSSPPTVEEAWVFGAYALVLNRAPDVEGLDGFVGAMRAGLTPLVLLSGLRTSREGREKRAHTPSDATEAFAWGCYLLALGRSPSQAERAELMGALAGGQAAETILAELCERAETQDALRFPPHAPDPVAALASAIERVAGLPHDQARHQRIVAELEGGSLVAEVVHRETHREARNWRGRLRARALGPLLTANAHAVAAAELASAEARATRDLMWRVEMRRRHERTIEKSGDARELT
jgi:hypothetical protein